MAQTFLIRSAADFGRTIQSARLKAGLTQQELADAVAVERTYVARIESGLSVLLLERALRMLRRLGAEVTVTVPDPAEQSHGR